ncbi:GPW/gp25 family protein [Actinoplanes sp. M2I2]|uniref:GPW/gp25 family protein n=1 Tax=Actinoplanes sp. M2I2 TaxID=1734444 RepID=UPI00201FF03B|nr:GPW/gp25 family protein [Actinoplanes sp. M2I2]
MTVVSVAADRLGTGWKLPLAPDPVRGALGYRSGPEKVQQAILVILLTEPGERVMRPDFGCGLRRFLMEPNTVAVRASIQRAVAAAIDAWEPRVRLREVTVTPGDDPALAIITIRYEHRRDAAPGTVVRALSLRG